MKVLIVEPGKKARVARIEEGMRSLQEIVGGDIEPIFPWEKSVAIILDIDGGPYARPLNRSVDGYGIIRGTFVVCGYRAGEFCSLPADLMEKYRKWFFFPEVFVKDIEGEIIPVSLDLEETGNESLD